MFEGQLNRAAPPKNSRKALLRTLADEVTAVGGVVRLEPTLSTSGPGLLLHRDPSDGIRLLLRGGTAHVDVNIAVWSDCQARSVAHQVQTTIARVLSAHGHPTSRVSVSVLAIEPSSSGERLS